DAGDDREHLGVRTRGSAAALLGGGHGASVRGVDAGRSRSRAAMTRTNDTRAMRGIVQNPRPSTQRMVQGLSASQAPPASRWGNVSITLCHTLTASPAPARASA